MEKTIVECQKEFADAMMAFVFGPADDSTRDHLQGERNDFISEQVEAAELRGDEDVEATECRYGR